MRGARAAELSKASKSNVRDFEYVGRFPAGCGAGVEHALAAPKIEPGRRLLRSGVMHRDQTVGESWQSLDRHRALQQQRRSAEVPGIHASRIERVKVGGDAGAAAVNPQRERRSIVAGGEYRRPGFRVLGLQTSDPPRRMAPARDGIGIGGDTKRVAPAQVVAQHAVDEGLESSARDFRGCRHGLIDAGVGVGAHLQPRQRREQQGAYTRFGDRLGHQPPKQEIAAAVVAQARVGQILRCRAQRRRRWSPRRHNSGQGVAQASPGDHLGDHRCRVGICRAQRRGTHRRDHATSSIAIARMLYSS